MSVSYILDCFQDNLADMRFRVMYFLVALDNCLCLILYDILEEEAFSGTRINIE